jgi:pseudouridine-5'-phosphate glycosidase
MRPEPLLDIRSEIATALNEKRPVVALESTLISHGLPWPINLETAGGAEKAVRELGAVPATIAVLQGGPTIGLTDAELEFIAKGKGIKKASRRDLGAAMANNQTAGTTVAATIFLAHQAGIRVLATGGIGGSHRPPADSWDISADLFELSRTPVVVVCAGAKSVVDIPRTLEILESLSVPVIGYGSDEFPAFYLRSSSRPVSARADSPEEAAKICLAHWQLKGSGIVLAQPVAANIALDPSELEAALAQVEKEAAESRIHGPALTPFLLGRLAEVTQGKTLEVNRELVIENARLAAKLARVMDAISPQIP